MQGFLRHGITPLLLVGSTLALAGGSIAAGAPEVIGINAAVLNNVRIKPAGTSAARAAQVRQRVALADEVQTGGKSQLQVLLLDKSVFTVGANARLTIDRFVYDPGRGARSIGASVVTGAFRFMSGRPDAKGSSSIRTPVATIGIRGTILDGVVGEDAVRIASGESGVGPDVRSDPATASLIILRGPGRAAQGRVQPGIIDVTSGGKTVTVDRPMRAVYVPRPGAAPIGPFIISPDGLREVQALIFPSLAPRFGLGPQPAGQPYYPIDNAPRARSPFPPDAYSGDSPGSAPPQGPGSYIPSIPQGALDRPPPRPRTEAPPSQTQAPPPATMSAPQSPPAPTAAPTPPPPPVDTQAQTPMPSASPTPQATPTPAPNPSPTPSPNYPPSDNPNGPPPKKP
jgi:hypothetical protein